MLLMRQGPVGYIKIINCCVQLEESRYTAAKGMKADSEDEPLPRYTLKEMNALLDEAEANFAAGKGIPHEEVMREMDEEEQVAKVE